MRQWIILLVLWGMTGLSADAATRLGLHFTQEELNIWRMRAVSGPYKSQGDAGQTYSPGDWDRIVANKNTWYNDPGRDLDRWLGNQSSTCPSVGAGWVYAPSRTLGEKIRDAAFWALVVDHAGAGGDQVNAALVRTAVRDELVTQTGIAGTEFTNTTKWCVQFPSCSTCLGSEEPVFEITMWLGRLLMAYDAIRYTLVAAGDPNVATIDQWFGEAGAYFHGPPRRVATQRYPNRMTDDYSNTPSLGTPAFNIIWYGGPQVYEFHMAWNNHAGRIMRLVGQIGILVNDATMKTSASQWFKEFVKYGLWYTNTGNITTRYEYNRWTDSVPTLGWHYGSVSLGSMITLADVFARNGDTSLYDYSTSAGEHGTTGGPKTLLAAALTNERLMTHVLQRYGTATAGNNGNAEYLIDSVCTLASCGGGGWHNVEDNTLAPGNNYWQSAEIKGGYLRTSAGAPAYPVSPANSGWNTWTGDWGLFPGVLFMYGQMADDQVAHPGLDPYNLTGDTTPPDAPTNFRRVRPG